MADIKQGLYVTELIGFGVNGVTGDYSRGASGFWIENGKITYAVSEVTIAGHLFDIFKSMGPASDLDCRYGPDAVRFTWEDNDEMDPAFGAGSAKCAPDGSLTGEICFHRGDESTFKARKW